HDALPIYESDVDTAKLLNDTVNYVFRKNRFDLEGDKVKLSAIIAGLMVSYCEVRDSGKRDEFGRPINSITTHHVAESEVVLDPMSTRDDYSDARWLHRFKWIPGETVERIFGKEALAKLESYHNHLEIAEADFEFRYDDQFQGRYRV